MDTQKYIDFLLNYAELLTEKIKMLLPDDHEELEVVYFVDYVTCDLLQAIALSNDEHWQIIDEYLKKHLFDELVVKNLETMTVISKNPGGPTAFLNEKSIARSDRMNEYKNSASLISGMIEENDNIIHNLVNRGSGYICSNKNDKMSFKKNLFPIIKEHSENYIESIRELAGLVKITGIVDIMISQENDIKRKINDEINEIPDKEELYHYSYYLVYNFYKNIDVISPKILKDYSSESLDSIVKSIIEDFPFPLDQNGIDKETSKVLAMRNDRFDDYKGMWNQIEHGEKSTMMAMFFGFASQYIYGKRNHMMSLSILYPEVQDLLRTGLETYLNVITEELKKQL